MPSLYSDVSPSIANPCTVKFTLYTVVLPVPVFGGDFTLPVYEEVHGVNCLYLEVRQGDELNLMLVPGVCLCFNTDYYHVL